jgi:hypothetical protein
MLKLSIYDPAVYATWMEASNSGATYEHPIQTKSKTEGEVMDLIKNLLAVTAVAVKMKDGSGEHEVAIVKDDGEVIDRVTKMAGLDLLFAVFP